MCGTNPFRVDLIFIISIPGFSLRSNHWAEISERLRRFGKSYLAQCLLVFTLLLKPCGSFD